MSLRVDYEGHDRVKAELGWPAGVTLDLTFNWVGGDGFVERLRAGSVALEVRLPHLASDFCCADSSRKPAASVRRALPNLTAADVGLHVDRRRPNHMILTATRFACLCRQHSQQQQHHG